MPSTTAPWADQPRNLRRLRPYFAYSAIYLFAIAFVIVTFAGLDTPQGGYAWLPQFGTKFEANWTVELQRATHQPTSEIGYDGQFYAQLALDPLLRDPATAAALDNPTFRARRPLLPALAHLAGLGEANRILQIYSTLNLVFWLGFAALAWRWFPPTGAQNVFRYLALVFTSGYISSLTRALLDGPSFTLLILGVFLVEKRRLLLGAGAMGLAGLTKETCVLAATGLPLPGRCGAREIFRWIAACTLVIAPILVWTLHIHFAIDRGEALGNPKNFAWPLVGWWQAVSGCLDRFNTHRFDRDTWITAAFLVSLPIQFGFLLMRWRVRDHWWRIGATFSLFGLVLGFATWEGLIGSASRIVLPATFAFNVLVPRGARWIPILLLGNALSFVGLYQIATTYPPDPEPFVEYAKVATPGADRDRLPYRFEKGWYKKEETWRQHRRWASGSATLIVSNPLGQPAHAELEATLISIGERAVTLSINGKELETISLSAGEAWPLTLRIPIEPGHNEILFSTPNPPFEAPGDSRQLSFCLRDYRLRIR